MKNRSLKTYFWLWVVVLISTSMTLMILSTPDGSISNQDFSSNEVGKIISPQMGNRHLNQPIVFNGYAILTGNAVHEVWDISNPRSPSLKKTISSQYKSGEAESHQVCLSRNGSGEYFMATISGKGFDIWNVTNTTNPEYVKAVTVSGVNYGDVDNGVWGLTWQGNYIYVGATNHGVRIYDVTNIQNPQLIKTITTTQLGGVKPGPLFAMGNVLVVTTPKDTEGIATVDISDPKNPIVLDSDNPSAKGSYIGGFYGNHAVLINPLRFYDVLSDPSNIKMVSRKYTGRAEYVSFDENKLFLGGLRGGSQGIHIYDLNDLQNINKIGRINGRDSRWDDQFSCPVGNTVIITDDQYVGGYVGGIMAVYKEDKDTKGPSVVATVPKADATNVPVTSSIGISFSDWIEFKSVDPQNFIVRPVNGNPIAGKWGWLYTTLTFGPELPLQRNTEYEVVLKKDITDYVGNNMLEDYVFKFSTGNTITPGTYESPIITGIQPTKVNETLSLAIENPSTGVDYNWSIDGDKVGTGTSLETIIESQGRHDVCVKVFRKTTTSSTNNILEAETGTYTGGVTTSSDNGGYSGDGYADFPGEQGDNVYLEWSVQIDEAITTDITLRYANGGATARPLNLTVNGGSQIKIDFSSTSGWTTYSDVVIEKVNLVSGRNTIRLTANAGSVGANIDRLQVDVPITPPEPDILESVCFIQVIHDNTAVSPKSSQTIIQSGNSIWNVNPDAGSITEINALLNTKTREIKVGESPQSLCKVNNEIWVANKDSYSISVINVLNGTSSNIQLPYSSEPVAVLSSHDENYVYVSLSAVGKVLKIQSQSREVIGEVDLMSETSVPKLGGLALDATGNKLLVSRFISENGKGKIYKLNANAMTLEKELLMNSTVTQDASNASRGIPNYIKGITISPNGSFALVPSKKDNIERGEFRDGNPLDMQNTVRAITSRVILSDFSEALEERIDIDNNDRCNAVSFSKYGEIAFVSLPGNEAVAALDAHTGGKITTFNVGKVPDGIVIDHVSNRLYTHNFLSRTVSVHDISRLVDGVGVPDSLLEISVVENEPLSAEVLHGKQLFYDAKSKKLNQSGYMSCASCHLNGSHDGQIWDLTSLGEGLRNTIDLRGRAGTKHGPLHWTANFDEVHDFENQIRSLGAGAGLLSDANFAANEDPLGSKKAGLSPELDALSAYVSSLDKVPNSPYSLENGQLSNSAKDGKAVFVANNCGSCHSGVEFTDSPSKKLHDIGTSKVSSGNRIGGLLTGFDTPTLKGVWHTAPYLHDGSALTLEEAVTAHEGVVLSEADLANLVRFLKELDETNSSILVNNKASINDLGIKISPNPTSDYLYITGVSKGQLIQIRDQLGRVVIGEIASKNSLKINVSNLNIGVYTLRVDNRASHSFVKQ